MKAVVILLLLAAFPAFAQRPGTESVEFHRDLPYAGTNNPRQRLDLYLPRNRKADKPLPVIAFIHGGGWRNVPYEQSVETDAALKKAGVPSLLIEVTRGGHGFGSPPEVDQRVERFFDMHLRGIKSEISGAAVVAPQRKGPQ